MSGNAAIWLINNQPPFPLIANAGAYNPGGGSPGVTSAIDTTGASVLIAATAAVFGSQGILTDSEGNTWTALTEYQSGGGNFGIQIRYALVPTVGSGHTFSIAGSNCSVAVAAFSGISSFDAQNGAGSASATAQQPGSVSPAVAPELFVTGLTFVDGTVPGSASIDSGFTITDNIANPAAAVAVALAFAIASAAQNPTWSSNVGAERIAAAMAAFK